MPTCKKQIKTPMPPQEQCVAPIKASFTESIEDKLTLLFILRPTDGLKLQIGSIVKTETCVAPLMIVELWKESDAIFAKLSPFDIISSSVIDDFFIQCNVTYITLWDGEKLKSKSVSDKVYNIASAKFYSFLQNNDSPSLRLFYRTILLGKVLRDNISSGFSNLNSSRFALGPFDVFCDGEIFGFGTVSSRKFALLEDGDFTHLDGIMGGKWDVKLGRDADSFFKFVTLIEVTQTNDFRLMVNVKFSEARFVFSNEYRNNCKRVIIERKHEIANNNAQPSLKSMLM